MDSYLKIIESKIKHNQELDEIGRQLETKLQGKLEPKNQGYYQYLLGLVFYKKGILDYAENWLETAAKNGTQIAEVHFVLFRIYIRKQNIPKALESLDKCIQLNHKVKYCLAKSIKLNYKSANYVMANNIIAEQQGNFSSGYFFDALRIGCLLHQKLNYEAEIEFRKYLEKFKLHQSSKNRLSGLLAAKNQNEYESRYQNNLSYFQKQGIFPGNYQEAPYKISRYLDNDLIYDCEAGVFITAIEEKPLDGQLFKLEQDDVMLIYKSDNVQVFKCLEKILSEVDSPVYRRRIGSIPVMVVDEHLANWQVMMQLFDFTTLADWYNIHYWLGVNVSDLESCFMVEDNPFPNILYGTDLDDLKELLVKIKTQKDQLYQTRIEKLTRYYQVLNQESIEKVLIITSIFNDNLFQYGNLLADYFKTHGYHCQVLHESKSFKKFTNYADAKILDEFYPDVAINLFGLKGEFPVFSQLKLPFINWSFFNKQLDFDSSRIYEDEYLILTGNPKMVDYFINIGYDRKQISTVFLPTTVQDNSQPTNINSRNDIGIIANLSNTESILDKLFHTISGFIIYREMADTKKIKTIFEAIYFSIYTETKQNFSKLPDTFYAQVIKEKFEQYNLIFDVNSTQLLISIFRQVIEDIVYQTEQIDWLLNGMEGFQLEIYGDGWDRDPVFQPFYAGRVDYLSDLTEYGRIVNKNKVNLYIGNKLNNDSYMQPDLINGIALGGFYLVNDLLVKEYGPSVLEPFGGLLETYGSKEEMLEKLHYYLQHDQERQQKARQLQEYVLQNFTVENVVKPIFEWFNERIKKVLN